MKLYRYLLLLILPSLLAIGASAQKNEFAAEVSGQFPSANNLSFDAAAGYQLNYAHRLIGVPGVSLYVEVPFLAGFSNTRTLTSLINNETYSSLYVTPGVKVKFVPAFPLSPYLVAGIGIAHFHSNTNVSENDFAADLGGGLDLKVFPHVSLRGELRDMITSTPGLNLGLLSNFANLSGTMNNFVASGGIVLRF